MPREPGVTSFSVLDGEGNVILHKEIIVTNVQPNYVRVRRMCGGGDANCTPSSYFYCFPTAAMKSRLSATRVPGNNIPPPMGAPAQNRGGGARPGGNDQLAPPQQASPFQHHASHSGGHVKQDMRPNMHKSVTALLLATLFICAAGLHSQDKRCACRRPGPQLHDRDA